MKLLNKCHRLVGVRSPAKPTKYQALPELIWRLSELIFQFCRIDFLSELFARCSRVSRVRLSGCSWDPHSSAAVTALYPSDLLFQQPVLGCIQHPQWPVIAEISGTNTIIPTSRFTISDHRLHPPPEVEMRLEWIECWSRVQSRRAHGYFTLINSVCVCVCETEMRAKTQSLMWKRSWWQHVSIQGHHANNFWSHFSKEGSRRRH